MQLVDAQGAGESLQGSLAAFVFKRRYLIVKRVETLSEPERIDLAQMLDYLPDLNALWKFSQDIYKVWATEQGRATARWRWTRLKNNPAYRAVPELAAALDGLGEEKLPKTLAFLGQPAGRRQKTNNHVERTNRTLRFDEKVRYKWRRRTSIVRFVLLRISRHIPKPKAQLGRPSADEKRAA